MKADVTIAMLVAPLTGAIYSGAVAICGIGIVKCQCGPGVHAHRRLLIGQTSHSWLEEVTATTGSKIE